MFSHMGSDTVVSTEVAAEAEVMAAVEDNTEFILADISRDDAFITMPLTEAASLPAWR
jgi:hypothetical protein